MTDKPAVVKSAHFELCRYSNTAEMSTHVKRIPKCSKSQFLKLLHKYISCPRIAYITHRRGSSTDVTALPLLCMRESSGPLYTLIPLHSQWCHLLWGCLTYLAQLDKLNLYQPSHLPIRNSRFLWFLWRDKKNKKEVPKCHCSIYRLQLN